MHFPTSAAMLEKKAPFSWGHIKKCIFHFARKVGARAFSACCAGAHAKNMPLHDSELPCLLQAEQESW